MHIKFYLKSFIHTYTLIHIDIHLYIMEWITSNLIVVTFKEKGFGRMEGMHKLEEGIVLPVLTFLYCLNFQILYMFYSFLFVILIEIMGLWGYGFFVVVTFCKRHKITFPKKDLFFKRGSHSCVQSGVLNFSVVAWVSCGTSVFSTGAQVWRLSRRMLDPLFHFHSSYPHLFILYVGIHVRFHVKKIKRTITQQNKTKQNLKILTTQLYMR